VKGHKKLSLETIVTLDPEVIILSAWQPEESDFLEKIRSHPALAHLSAVRKNRVFVLSEKYLTTVSQYIVDATEALARLIHPTRFEP
jgi:iron complex transport system substrate-binding protein